jgi:hypothetical protein
MIPYRVNEKIQNMPSSPFFENKKGIIMEKLEQLYSVKPKDPGIKEATLHMNSAERGVSSRAVFVCLRAIGVGVTHKLADRNGVSYFRIDFTESPFKDRIEITSWPVNVPHGRKVVAIFPPGEARSCNFIESLDALGWVLMTILADLVDIDMSWQRRYGGVRLLCAKSLNPTTACLYTRGKVILGGDPEFWSIREYEEEIGSVGRFEYTLCCHWKLCYVTGGRLRGRDQMDLQTRFGLISHVLFVCLRFLHPVLWFLASRRLGYGIGHPGPSFQLP